MYHCPECSTILTPAAGATRTDAAQAGLYLDMLYYNCPGCGQHYLQRVKQYAERDATDEWYHVAGDKTLLMHHPWPDG